MKELQIQAYKVLLDDEDYDRIANMSWHSKVISTGSVYFDHSFWSKELQRPRTISLQRVVMMCEFGDKRTEDHISGDTLDNRKCNLRFVDEASNAKNQKARKNKSGYKGVDMDKLGRWRARITVNYKCITLGTFPTALEAHQAYLKAAEKYFGEFARKPEYL